MIDERQDRDRPDRQQGEQQAAERCRRACASAPSIAIDARSRGSGRQAKSLELCLKNHVSGVRAARRAAMLRDAGARRDVAELVADEPHAHKRRRLADRADPVLLVDQDLPDLLRGLVALVAPAGRRRRGTARRSSSGSGRSARALRAARRVPLGEFRPHEGLGRIDRDRVAREQIEQLGAAIGPHEDVVLVVARAGARRACAPSRGPRRRCRSCASAARPSPSAAARAGRRARSGSGCAAARRCRCAGGSRRGPSWSGRARRASGWPWRDRRVDHLLRHSGPGLCGRLSAGAIEPGVPTPSQKVSLSWSRSMPERQRAAEVGVGQPLRDLGIGRVALIDLEHRVRAVEGEIEMHVVVAAFSWFSRITGSLAMSMWRSCRSYSPAMARRFSTSRSSASVS